MKNRFEKFASMTSNDAFEFLSENDLKFIAGGSNAGSGAAGSQTSNTGSETNSCCNSTCYCQCVPPPPEDPDDGGN
jgi:hypothetical protein